MKSDGCIKMWQLIKHLGLEITHSFSCGLICPRALPYKLNKWPDYILISRCEWFCFVCLLRGRTCACLNVSAFDAVVSILLLGIEARWCMLGTGWWLRQGSTLFIMLQHRLANTRGRNCNELLPDIACINLTSVLAYVNICLSIDLTIYLCAW